MANDKVSNKKSREGGYLDSFMNEKKVWTKLP
jgi:hypothetical protein